MLSLSTAGRSEPGKSLVASSNVTVAMIVVPFTGRYVPDDPSGGWTVDVTYPSTAEP
jgi:hypothetical protein